MIMLMAKDLCKQKFEDAQPFLWRNHMKYVKLYKWWFVYAMKYDQKEYLRVLVFRECISFSIFIFQSNISNLFEAQVHHQTQGCLYLNPDGKAITTETSMKCKNLIIFSTNLVAGVWTIRWYALYFTWILASLLVYERNQNPYSCWLCFWPSQSTEDFTYTYNERICCTASKRHTLRFCPSK